MKTGHGVGTEQGGSFLALPLRDYSSAFIRVLAVLEANGVFVGTLPFGATTGTGSFVFVTPDFKFSSTHVTVNVCRLWLQKIA